MILTLCYFLLFNGVKVSAGPIIDDPFDPPVSKYVSNIDIKSNSPVTERKSFTGKIHNKFGNIYSPTDSVSNDIEDFVVYDSKWTAQDDVTKPHVSTRYDTYYFEKYIDIPIETLHSRKVAAGKTESFTLQLTESHEELTSKTTTKATNRYIDFTNTISYSMGASVKIDDINLNNELTAESSIKVGGSVSDTVVEVKSSITRFSIVYTESFNFDNSNSNHDVYFDLNFRQKFRIYFTTRYKYNYNKSEYRSGMFNRDIHYSYSLHNFMPIGTYTYLIPVEQPYFEMSKYYDNVSGIKEILKNNPHNNIISI